MRSRSKPDYGFSLLVLRKHINFVPSVLLVGVHEIQKKCRMEWIILLFFPLC